MMRTTLLLCLWALSLSYAQLSETEEAGGEEEAVELFTTDRTKMAAATSDFGYNLFRALAGRDPKTNVFLCPISVSAALTQLSMGASPDRSERWLYRALRYHTLQDPQLHNTLRDLLASLRAPGKGLSIAARIYLARRLRLKQDYFDLVEKQYGVRPKALMGGAKDVSEINDWVKQQTSGKVNSFLSKPLGRNAGVFPVGAAYFKGKWITRFSQSGAMEDFQLDGEAPARIPMMQQDNYPVKMGVDSDLGCTIIQIQMQDDVSMFVFLPDDVTQNMTLVEDSLTAEFVQDLSMTLHNVKAALTLPVLKFSYSTDLLPLLAELGLDEFLADTDLSKITTQTAKLGSLNHKVVMEMAPEGTQYASSSPAQAPLTYRVDRPFLFLVRDEASGALLFIGRVVNPRSLRI
ncbi:pigment epithelium-derived factor [Esox lucius]|nr:pigment epithelium-derived factor [Esox lucius]XP_019903397.1 pigment epithelium-derived factor [Esox lucius]XP_019903398.1 pigment epithelium-derived factor [Esox lucius]